MNLRAKDVKLHAGFWIALLAMPVVGFLMIFVVPGRIENQQVILAWHAILGVQILMWWYLIKRAFNIQRKLMILFPIALLALTLGSAAITAGLAAIEGLYIPLFLLLIGINAMLYLCGCVLLALKVRNKSWTDFLELLMFWT